MTAGDITFIKCDVEGHELQCIKGSINLIRKFRPGWRIEVSGDPADSNNPVCETFSLLNAEGYQGFWFDGAYLKKWQSGDKSVNYFLLAPKHVSVLASFLPSPGQVLT